MLIHLLLLRLRASFIIINSPAIESQDTGESDDFSEHQNPFRFPGRGPENSGGYGRIHAPHSGCSGGLETLDNKTGAYP